MEPPAVAALALLGFGFAFVLSQNSPSDNPKNDFILDSTADTDLSPEDILPARLNDNFNNPVCWKKYKLIRTVVCFVGFHETDGDDGTVRPMKNCTHEEMHEELELYRIWLRINKNCNKALSITTSAELSELRPTNHFVLTLTLTLALAEINI